MKICLFTFYFQPDLCAGSFRNTALVDAMVPLLKREDQLDIITTRPNRYSTYRVHAPEFEILNDQVRIFRVRIPVHKSGFIDQALSFYAYYQKANKLVKNKQYDLIIASSSRLFTAFLGARMSKRLNAPYYLDLRDLFRINMSEILKNPVIKYPFMYFLRKVEKFTLKQADRINIVSEGFSDYIRKYDVPVSFYPNGIDDDFLDFDFKSNENKKKHKIITYAGNIGEGQGLHRIIPEVAKNVKKEGFFFRIIGDGGARPVLERELKRHAVSNVELINPVNRDQLLHYYMKSDYLLLHLNDYDAFKKVLPSKVFEYAATKKPIFAGVAGYSRVFLQKHVNGIFLFNPCDTEAFSSALINHSLPPGPVNRDDFIHKFARKSIMQKMAEEIINNYRVG